MAQTTRTRKNSQAATAARVRKITPGFILPSSAFTVNRKQVKRYVFIDKKPAAGDLVYGTISHIGEHASLENKEGRLHKLGHGSRAVFVFGNRYAPNYYEGVVPENMTTEADLLARSGMVGTVRSRSTMVKDPTRVRLKGFVIDEKGEIINTTRFSLIKPKKKKKSARRAKMILVVGTSMNCGKSTAATACCWALAAMGYCVRASKVTGTASLKDILHMEDSGASPVSDFTHMGHPSTYLLERDELLKVFNDLDLKYANNPSNYWVVELADGLLQRETAMLLEAEDVRKRIHKLIFCANDALGAIGGLDLLTGKMGLEPDAVSGVCSSSPLMLSEISRVVDVPVFNSMERKLDVLSSILI